MQAVRGRSFHRRSGLFDNSLRPSQAGFKAEDLG